MGATDKDKTIKAGKKAWTFAEEELAVETVPAKKDEKPPVKTIGFFSLWRFATRMELLGVLIGSIASMAIGAIMPAQILIFGNIVSDIAPLLANPTEDALLNALLPLIYQMIYLGIGMLVGGYIAQCMWVLTGEYQTRRIRELYVHAILRQDMAWFDKADEGSLSTRLALDTQLVQDAISEKAGATMQSLAQFIAGFIIAFVKGWRLALVMLAGIPIMAVSGGVIFKFVTKFMSQGQDSYADAGAIAESAIAGIRTVYSFSLQKRFQEKYDGHLAKAEKANIVAGLVIGWGFGVFLFIMFGTYGLAFWYGSRLVIGQTDGMDAGSVLVVFLSMIMGAMALMQLPTNVAAFGTGRAAAYKIWKTIERNPVIDTDSEEGQKPQECFGRVTFEKVKFNYPTRPDAKILRRLSIDIKPGMTVAFVGPSGSGKSTTVSLIQRFYDPLSGSVKIDGVDVKELNLKWLRQQIGIVSQEPVLFNMSIKENLKLGARDRTNVSDDEITEACKKANCHSFIKLLPNGYDTLVGEHGGMLSGGQKQRIAIARALLKDPKILLLDEATSALDTTSERLVQKALDAASKDRTTVVIAHRLSTIKNADLIVVLDKGKMAEMGTHDELYAQKGIYTGLVDKQRIKLKQDPTAIGVEAELTEAELAEQLKQETMKLKLAQEVQKADGTVELQLHMNETAANKIQDERRVKVQGNTMLRVVAGMKSEWMWLLIGSLAAVVMGAVFPLYGFIFSKIIVVLSMPPDMISPGPLEGANLYAFVIVMIGVAALFGCGLQISAFFYAGAKYTRRLRADTFKAMLRQEMGFYDLPGNSVGALSAALATEAAGVNDVVTKVWGDVIQLFSGGATGIIIAFIYSWQLALVISACVPFIALATAFESQVHAGFEDKTKKAYTESGEIATEAIREIRTVTALTVQDEFEGKFVNNILFPHKLALRKAYLASIGYGAHQGLNMLTSALGFYAGIRFIGKGWIDFQDMFVVILCLMITAGTMGRTSLFVSKYIKAKHNAASTFTFLDRQTLIDPDLPGEDAGKSMKTTDLDLKDINFRYPARPDVPIFSGEFQFDGKQNQTIALVGGSGCGKSTTIGLLQRWYDPLGGEVAVDGRSVQDYQLKSLRGEMALVGQEPVLFDMTIRENILYGHEHPETVTEEDIEEVAKMSNIVEFLDKLPDRLETRVGEKGGQLSGGQKQRVAIARALIRKPKILLLDEATSALDSESEKMVQQALDRAIQGRTTITIAHRLSTIQNADQICVVKEGKVIERGKHFELLALNGVYKGLVDQQDLDALNG